MSEERLGFAVHGFRPTLSGISDQQARLFLGLVPLVASKVNQRANHHLGGMSPQKMAHQKSGLQKERQYVINNMKSWLERAGWHLRTRTVNAADQIKRNHAAGRPGFE